MSYRVTRPNGSSTEVKAPWWVVNTRGELVFKTDAGLEVRAFAHGYWAEVETIEPDPYTAATNAASAGAAP